MSLVNVRDLLNEARQAEKDGKKKDASGKYGSLGIYLRKKGKYKESILFLRRAIQLSRSSPRLYVQLALSLFEAGDSVGAEKTMELFTKHALQREDLSTYREYMENTLAHLPMLRRIFYERVVLIDKTNALPFLQLAKVYMEMEKYDEARKYLIDALKTKTHTEKIISELRLIFEKQGEYNSIEALERFNSKKLPLEDLIIIISNRTPKSNINSTTSQELPSMIKNLEEQLGFVLNERDENISPLISEFRTRSNEIIGSDTKTRLDLAYAFFEMQLFADAKEEIYKIGPLDEHYFEAQLLLVDILFEEGSYLAALDILQKCLREGKMSLDFTIEAKYKLIKVYYELGDIKNALTIAIDIEREHTNYRDVRELIQKLRNSV